MTPRPTSTSVAHVRPDRLVGAVRLLGRGHAVYPVGAAAGKPGRGERANRFA